MRAHRFLGVPAKILPGVGKFILGDTRVESEYSTATSRGLEKLQPQPSMSLQVSSLRGYIVP